jgi:hypothetical protein
LNLSSNRPVEFSLAAPHPYSRLEFRQRLKTWIRINIKFLGYYTLGLVAVIALEVAILSTVKAEPLRWWMLGAVPMAAVAAYLHLLHVAFLTSDGQAILHLRGAWGEDSTREELRRAKRKGLVWGWVDSIGLQYGDIDHLVVTRSGGLVAVDSKWRSRVADPTDMARAAQRVRLRAEAITRDLLKGDSHGSRRARVNPLQVRAVVVLWGAAQHDVPAGATIDGIEFIAGRKIMDWLAQLDGQSVDKAAAKDIVRSLEAKREVMANSTAR